MKMATSKETFMVIYEPAVLWMENCVIHGVLIFEKKARRPFGYKKHSWLSQGQDLILQGRDWNEALYMEMWRNETHANHFTLLSSHVKWTSRQFIPGGNCD
jgi:hypothetical protein